MAWVPPHLRGKKVGAIVPMTGVRFIGNATGNINIAPNTGIRFEPRHKAPTKKTLKAKRILTPEGKPPQAPSHALRKAAPKFQKAVQNHLEITEWEQPGPGKRRHTRRAKPSKKAKKTKKSKKPTRKHRR